MQVALVGLGVMGKNLALNLIEKGLTLVAYDTIQTLVKSYSAAPKRKERPSACI